MEDFVGEFGKVYLVADKHNKSLYALKAISKGKIIENELENQQLLEKNILESLNHPLIMKGHRTFQDDNNVYFLLSHIQGLELFDVIRKMDFLNNDQARFYIFI